MNEFSHDIIKIKYVNEGYLPNYPYHQISDREMVYGFIGPEGYFYDNFPMISPDLSQEYYTLVQAIQNALDAYLENDVTIPDWVYSYMLGSAISVNSDERDILYLSKFYGIAQEGGRAVFTPELAQCCLQTSKDWIAKLPSSKINRPPTIFGEPHVIKSLRLSNITI